MPRQVEHLRFVDLAKPRYPVYMRPSGFSKPTAKICESDEFRMYEFKIKLCPKSRFHDWTQCPYAHENEKARRRDLCMFNYIGIACPDFRRGSCPRGNSCGFAHGLFEFWLHPARYRTRACKAGGNCRRKVCFFAHTHEQLRSGTKYKGQCQRAQPGCGAAPLSSPENKVGEVGTSFGGDTSDTPDINWVWELLN